MHQYEFNITIKSKTPLDPIEVLDNLRESLWPLGIKNREDVIFSREDPDAQFSKPRQLKMRLWDLWHKTSTTPREYSGIDVHIEKRLLMGRVAALIDEVFGLQFSDVAGLPLGGFEELKKHWIINEKVKVNKEWDNILFTSLQSKQKENLTMDELLELIKGKGIGGIGIVGYDDTNSFTLTLLDTTIDVERTP